MFVEISRQDIVIVDESEEEMRVYLLASFSQRVLKILNREYHWNRLSAKLMDFHMFMKWQAKQFNNYISFIVEGEMSHKKDWEHREFGTVLMIMVAVFRCISSCKGRTQAGQT